jgi:hypothetical protein
MRFAVKRVKFFSKNTLYKPLRSKKYRVAGVFLVLKPSAIGDVRAFIATHDIFWSFTYQVLKLSYRKNTE